MLSPVFAQLPQSNPLLSGLQSRASSLPTGQSVPQEGPLEPSEYLVGPGDVFEIGIGGQLAHSQRATVTADGILIIPELGSFDVADQTLASVISEVSRSLRRRFTNVQTTVALAEPRQFYVHVSGAGLDPGRHLMVPVSRVEDAIVAAMGGVSPQRLRGMTPARQALAVRVMQATEAAALEPGSIQPRDALLPPTKYHPSFRNILVTHRDGTIDRVDLLQYYATGSTDANPYLRDGDSVYLPFYNPDESSVGVSGAVAEPSVFDYRSDDTALSVLALVIGPEVASIPNDVRLLRIANDEIISTIISGDELAATHLQSGDRLHVVPMNTGSGSVEVLGAATFPGSFPIREDETTLAQLVEMAGGILPDALLRAAYLERATPHLPDASTSVDASQLAMDPTLDAGLREAALAQTAFERARLSTLDFVQRQYLAREFLGFQRVSLNLSEALQPGARHIRLRDGDRLIIPFNTNAVYVFGQVLRPGYVDFEQGTSVEQYVSEAGGRGSGATQTYVIDAASGAVSEATEGMQILSGDLIFVNREAFADDRMSEQLIVQQEQLEVMQRREDREATRAFVASILQAAGVVVSVIAILTR